MQTCAEQLPVCMLCIIICLSSAASRMDIAVEVSDSDSGNSVILCRA